MESLREMKRAAIPMLEKIFKGTNCFTKNKIKQIKQRIHCHFGGKRWWIEWRITRNEIWLPGLEVQWQMYKSFAQVFSSLILCSTRLKNGIKMFSFKMDTRERHRERERERGEMGGER